MRIRAPLIEINDEATITSQVEWRDTGHDRGFAIRINTLVDGTMVEVLKYDPFEINSHFHEYCRDTGRELIRPMPSGHIGIDWALRDLPVRLYGFVEPHLFSKESTESLLDGIEAAIIEISPLYLTGRVD